MQQIAGIDGCQSRWLAIARVPGSPSFVAQVLATSELPAQPWALAAIDVPIGLPDSGTREADRAARKFIGPRASSVFPCPIRPVLDATSWQEDLRDDVPAQRPAHIAPNVRDSPKDSSHR